MSRHLSCVLLRIFVPILLLFDSVFCQCDPNEFGDDLVDFNLVHSWAQSIGSELWQINDLVARKKEVQESFKGFQVETVNGNKMVQEIARNLHSMMKMRVDAVNKIVETAEYIVANLPLDPRAPLEYMFLSSKEDRHLRPTTLPKVIYKNITVNVEHSHFDMKFVNVSYSSIHVPTDVFDWLNDSMKAMWWSENLDPVFIENYEYNPTLSWQYFGSVTGIMRHYPAMRWEDEPVDLYDCRIRPWYIEASASPKDIVIIIDMSGSMTSFIDIGRQAVYSILDTLSNNDFVNVIMMTNDSAIYVVPCFNATLVPANIANIRELKLKLESYDPHGKANFEETLTTSFEVLRQFREEKEGAGCNQAIMLITDGIYDNFLEIFKKYNLQNTSNIPVRIFTYLIAIEDVDEREELWMACANQGYFSLLTNTAEVKEKVLKYIPVMSRPLALYGDHHPVIWTPVYVNLIEPIMTDYLWNKKQEEDQEKIVKSYRSDKKLFKTNKELMRRENKKLRDQSDQYSDGKPYMFMISVSIPAYNKTKIDSSAWNLLGVAGTDVPIADIKHQSMLYKLGVNGYFFIVTNNGYVLTHPDFRPVFFGILKPGYNMVDMLEVELINYDNSPREFHEELIKFRNDIIQQENGSMWMHIKYHYDKMVDS